MDDLLKHLEYLDGKAHQNEARPRSKAWIERTQSIRSIIEQHVFIIDGWLPTPENINVLPESIRNYIQDIETNSDHAGMIRENVILKDIIKAFQQKPIIIEQERAEAIEFTKIWMPILYEESISSNATPAVRKQARIYRTILKALGGEK